MTGMEQINPNLDWQVMALSGNSILLTDSLKAASDSIKIAATNHGHQPVVNWGSLGGIFFLSSAHTHRVGRTNKFQ
jgi:hypothetical protein